MYTPCEDGVCLVITISLHPTAVEEDRDDDDDEAITEQNCASFSTASSIFFSVQKLKLLFIQVLLLSL